MGLARSLKVLPEDHIFYELKRKFVASAIISVKGIRKQIFVQSKRLTFLPDSIQGCNIGVSIKAQRPIHTRINTFPYEVFSEVKVYIITKKINVILHRITKFLYIAESKNCFC